MAPVPGRFETIAEAVAPELGLVVINATGVEQHIAADGAHISDHRRPGRRPGPGAESVMPMRVLRRVPAPMTHCSPSSSQPLGTVRPIDQVLGFKDSMFEVGQDIGSAGDVHRVFKGVVERHGLFRGLGPVGFEPSILSIASSPGWPPALARGWESGADVHRPRPKSHWRWRE